MYVLVVLPLEVAFAEFEENDVSGITCTLVFVFDIVICFRTGTICLTSVPDRQHRHTCTGISEGNTIELRPTVCGMRYLKGASFIQFFFYTCFPFGEFDTQMRRNVLV
jgi:hypothetical protein